jgi:histidinol-phosphate aminotransferase
MSRAASAKAREAKRETESESCEKVKPEVEIPKRVRRLPVYPPMPEGREGLLRLDFNENTIGCTPAVLRAIRGLSAERIAMYPEYTSIVKKLARYFGVLPAEMMITNGADEAIAQIAHTFLEAASRVLLVEPTFPMYRFCADISGARIESLRYDSEMKLPARDLAVAFRKKPQAFFLANPNNPTGTLLSNAAIRNIVNANPRTLIIVDEAYFEFSGSTVLPWIGRYSNLIVLRTFSKAAGMAGLRLGCIFAGEELMQWLRRTREPFPVNCAAMAAAEAVIQDASSVRKYAVEISASRKMLVAALQKLGVRTIPSVANFVLVDFGDDAPRILGALRKRGILLRDRAVDFGRPGFVRITIGTRVQMKRLIRELSQLSRLK